MTYSERAWNSLPSYLSTFCLAFVYWVMIWLKWTYSFSLFVNPMMSKRSWLNLKFVAQSINFYQRFKYEKSASCLKNFNFVYRYILRRYRNFRINKDSAMRIISRANISIKKTELNSELYLHLSTLRIDNLLRQ
jgi:hypothetical protein